MPRAMWSGAISFGLVNIPVKLFKATATASAKRDRSFHQIHKTCGTRIKHVRWCPKDEIEVPWDEVAKGYEVEKGKYVEVSKEELDALLPEEDRPRSPSKTSSRSPTSIPSYYDRAYYVSPAGSPKAYALLHEVLARKECVAVAHVLLRTRSHLALVRVLDDHLVLETMYFDAEIVDAGDIEGVKKTHVDKKQLEVAEKLVESMTIEWEPSRYKDEYTQKVKHVIEQKLEGGEVVESPTTPGVEGAKVVDLLAALRASVDATKARGKKHPETLADVAGLQPLARVGKVREKRAKSAPRRRAHAAKRSRARRG